MKTSIQFQPLNRIIPDAYHGTGKSEANEIEKEGFKVSTGEKQYLGDGVYFFESSQLHAINWAVNRFGFSDKAVFRCEVILGRCFDLTDGEHLEVLSKIGKMILQRASNSASSKPIEITDALVINLICQNVDIDTVRAVHISPKKGKIFGGSKYFAHTQLMICVKKIENISKIERVI